MGTLEFNTDNLFELRGPVDIATNAAFGVASGSITKIYDTALDCLVGFYTTVTTADALSAATSIFVQDRTPFFVGDTIGIAQDDGTEIRAVITSLPGSEGEIVFTGEPLTADSVKGSNVRRLELDSTSTFITVDNWDGWENNMQIQITEPDEPEIERTISFIDRNSGYATISSSLGVRVVVGALAKRKIGPSVTMTAFGVFPTSNPVIGDPAWGFRGVIIYDHPEIRLGMRVRAEIHIVDSISTTAMTRKAVATYINV